MSGPEPADAQPPPPFEGIDGYWVARDDFRGLKSFGLYRCKAAAEEGECGNKWSSAHATKNYRQGCRKCEALSQPWLLWYNTSSKARDTNPNDKKIPHDRKRCEACALGVCTAGDADDLATALDRLCF